MSNLFVVILIDALSIVLSRRNLFFSYEIDFIDLLFSDYPAVRTVNYERFEALRFNFL